MVACKKKPMGVSACLLCCVCCGDHLPVFAMACQVWMILPETLCECYVCVCVCVCVVRL